MIIIKKIDTNRFMQIQKNSRSKDMTDASPVVNLKKAMSKLKVFKINTCLFWAFI